MPTKTVLEAPFTEPKTQRPIRLNLCVEYASHSTVFFSHNKLANNTFSYDFFKQANKLTNQ